MNWYEVPILATDEGGLFVSWNGVQRAPPPGSVLHVLKADPDPPATGLLGTLEPVKARDGWIALDTDGARKVFERFYGAAPTDREVYEKPPAAENTVAATAARLVGET